MPVARIFSESASDAASLAAHLHDLGYTIELASPNSDTSLNADLEIRLERCSRGDALAQAERRARELGADVYVAAGALAAIPGPVAAERPRVELTNVAASSVAPVARTRDPLSPTIAAAVDAGDFDPQQVAAPAPAQDVTAAVSLDVPQPLPEISPVSGNTPTVLMEIEDREGAIPVMSPSYALFGQRMQPDSQEDFVAAHTHPPREIAERSIVTHGAAAVRHFSRQASEATVQGVASVRRRFIGSIHAMAESYSRLRSRRAETSKATHSETAPAEIKPAVIPAESLPTAQVAPPEVQPVPAATQDIAPSPQPARAGRPLPWIAFAGSGAVAAAVLVTWSVLAGHPAAPLIPVNGNIEQQIPFGPVKIHPQKSRPVVHSAAPSAQQTSVEPVPATPLSASRTTQAAASAPASASMPRPYRARRVARRASPDDEVIVRHYGKPVATTKTQISSTGVKHISDQE